MTIQANPVQPVRGFKKFAISFAVILCALLSLSGIVILICVIMALSVSPQNESDTVSIILTFAILIGFTAGVIWLTYFLNRILKAGTKKIEPRAKANPFVCAACGVEAPVIWVGIHRHIGAVIMMYHNSIKGNFCRGCIWDSFWKETSMTLLLGWWGIISFFITPIVLINNVVMYVRSLFIPANNREKVSLRLNEADISLIRPMHTAITEQLDAGIKIELISTALSKATGVTPGQAYLYISRIPAI